MNKRIGYSLLISLGFYAGTTFGMGVRSAGRGATTAFAPVGRYRLPPTVRPGGVPTTRSIMTMQPSSWSAEPTSVTQSGFSRAERSKLFRPMHTQVQPSMGKSSKGGYEDWWKNYSKEEFVEEFFNKFKGLVSDVMLWVSGALTLWAAKEFVDAKKDAAFQEKMKAFSKKRKEIDVLLDRLDDIEKSFTMQSASSNDKKEFITSLESAKAILVNEYTRTRANPYYNIADLTTLTNNVVLQLKNIVNKYTAAPQSYSAWAYEKVSKLPGIAGLARYYQARSRQQGNQVSQEELSTHNKGVVEEVD